MSAEIKKLDVSKLDVSNIEFSGFEELKAIQLEVVKNNPYVEILDNKTFDEAKKSRTALKLARTSVQNQDKLIASNLQGVRKLIKSKHDELIEIVSGHEEKQQIEVTRFEQIKENERLERDRLETERVEKIKNKIDSIENESYKIINSWTFENIKNADSSVFIPAIDDFDFEEYEILLDQVKERIQNVVSDKVASLRTQENERLEKIKLQEEKEAAEKKANDLQAKFDAQNAQIEKERLAREEIENKAKIEAEKKDIEEKESIFKIRRNRLSEIGLVLVSTKFVHADAVLEISKENIYNSDTIEFENILINSKKTIQEEKEQFEKEKAKKESSEKAEIKLKNKLEKENIDRVKRLSKDKAIYKKTVSDFLVEFPAWFEADNVEIKEFSMEAKNRVVQLQNELLTELENL